MTKLDLNDAIFFFFLNKVSLILYFTKSNLNYLTSKFVLYANKCT